MTLSIKNNMILGRYKIMQQDLIIKKNIFNNIYFL